MQCKDLRTIRTQLDVQLLVARLPYMFRGCWPLEIFTGWSSLVVDACISIDKLLADQDRKRFRWWTVREKFGRLCFGYCLAEPGGDALPEGWEMGDDIKLTRSEEIDFVVEAAESASLHTCIHCGSRARLRQVDGYRLVCCPEHHAKWEMLAQGFPVQHAAMILQASMEPDFYLHWRRQLILPHPLKRLPRIGIDY